MNKIMFRFLTRSLSGSRALKSLEQAPQAVLIIDPRGQISFFNAAAERLWSASKSEMIGQSASALFRQHAFRDLVTNDNKPVEICLRTRNGSEFWAAVTAVGDALADTTLFVREINAERHTREVMRQTLEHAPDAVVSVNENGQIGFIN